MTLGVVERLALDLRRLSLPVIRELLVVTLPEDDRHDGDDEIADDLGELLRVDVRVGGLLLRAQVVDGELSVGADDGLLAANHGGAGTVGTDEGLGVVVVDARHVLAVVIVVGRR